MAFAKVVTVDSVAVEGADVVVSFRLPVDGDISKVIATIDKHEDGQVFLVLAEECLNVEPNDVNFQQILSRSKQTSWAQALKERLTGKGPKQAKE